MVKGIIFDFDGVIVESLHIKSNAFKQIYMPYGEEIANQVVKHHEANGGISRFNKFKYYHKVFLNKNISEEKIKELSNKFSNIVINKVIKSKYVSGSLDFIVKSFKHKKLFISTGTPKVEIDKILLAKNIDKYFVEVYGSPEDKIEHVQKIIYKYNLTSKELVFFGDSKSDLEAAKYFDIEFTLIKNSFNYEISSNYNGRIINNFKDLSI